MANLTYQPILITSIAAAAELATKYLFIGFDGNVASAGAAALGVLQAATDSGEQAPVGAQGIFLVIAGGAISVGEAVEVGTGGKAAAYSAGVSIGRALDEATTDGDIIRVLL